MTRRKEVLENGDKQLGMPSQDFCWKISKKAQANIFVYTSSRVRFIKIESLLQALIPKNTIVIQKKNITNIIIVK